jgi:hypothetical protein
VIEGEEYTFQHHKNDPNKITKLSEKWVQLDLQLANYAQNSDRRLSQKCLGDMSGLEPDLSAFARYIR